MSATVAAAALGCGEDGSSPTVVPAAGAAPRLTVVAGDGQSAYGGETLQHDVRIRIADASGRPIAGLAVEAVATSGGGVVTPGTITSNTSGVIAFRWRLGATAGPQEMVVRAAGVDPVRLVATSIALVTADVVIVQGRGGQSTVVEFADIGAVFHVMPASDSVFRLPPRGPRVVRELIVMSQARAPAVVTNPWTAGLDTVRVALRDPLVVPISVWIHTSYDAVAARVRADVAEANRVYREAGLGITIGPVTLHDATASGLAPSTCADDVPVDGGRINVHYIERSAMDHAGYACSLTRVIIGHGSLPYGNILAHELGHVFGLAHASDPGNLMHLDAKGAALTPGQVFRANYHTGSAVATVYGFNRVGRRDCDTVTCPPQFISGG